MGPGLVRFLLVSPRLYPWKYIKKVMEIHEAAKLELRDAFPKVSGLKKILLICCLLWLKHPKGMAIQNYSLEFQLRWIVVGVTTSMNPLKIHQEQFGLFLYWFLSALFSRSLGNLLGRWHQRLDDPVHGIWVGWLVVRFWFATSHTIRSRF